MAISLKKKKFKLCLNKLNVLAVSQQIKYRDNKIKNKNHTVCKLNIKIMERSKMDTPSTQIHDRSPSWLDTPSTQIHDRSPSSEEQGQTIQ
jgi:hypothetical protein